MAFIAMNETLDNYGDLLVLTSLCACGISLPTRGNVNGYLKLEVIEIHFLPVFDLVPSKILQCKTEVNSLCIDDFISWIKHVSCCKYYSVAELYHFFVWLWLLQNFPAIVLHFYWNSILSSMVLQMPQPACFQVEYLTMCIIDLGESCPKSC